MKKKQVSAEAHQLIEAGRERPDRRERRHRPHFHFSNNPVTLKQAANSSPFGEPVPGYLPLAEPAVEITRPNAVKSTLLPPPFPSQMKPGAAAVAGAGRGREMSALCSKRCLITSSGLKRGGINRARSPRRCCALGKQECAVYS